MKTFGQPHSITPASFINLNNNMKMEGILLLKEMGMKMRQVQHASGLSTTQIKECLRTPNPMKLRSEHDY